MSTFIMSQGFPVLSDNGDVVGISVCVDSDNNATVLHFSL
jgi:hypothetical protein